LSRLPKYNAAVTEKSCT